MNRSQRRVLAMSKDPQNLGHVAQLYKKAGRIEKAEEMYREAIALDPRCYEAHNKSARSLRISGASRKQRDTSLLLSKSTQKTPSSHLISVSACRRNISSGRPFPSIAKPSRSSRLTPTPHFGLAFALTQLAEDDAADHHYREALKIDPLYFEARVNLGLAFVERGKVVGSV